MTLYLFSIILFIFIIMCIYGIFFSICFCCQFITAVPYIFYFLYMESRFCVGK